MTPRRFLVSYDPARHTMNVSSTSHSTRVWCTEVGADGLLAEVLEPLLQYKAVVRKDAPYVGMGVVTPTLVARVVEKTLRGRFPEEEFVVAVEMPIWTGWP